MAKLDNCGIPNKANWHVLVVFNRSTGDFIAGEEVTETYTDIYVCDEHMPADLTVVSVGKSMTIDFGKAIETSSQEELALWTPYESAVRSLVRWDGHEKWDILEFVVSHLR